MSRTYLVLPPWSDQAGRLHIVARDGDHFDAFAQYRQNPGLWAEVGYVAATAGTLLCLDAPAAVVAEFRDLEPIRPPLVVCSNRIAHLES